MEQSMTRLKKLTELLKMTNNAFDQATIASVNLANAMKALMEQHQEAIMMEQEKQLKLSQLKPQSLNVLASLEISSKKLNKIINDDQA